MMEFEADEIAMFLLARAGFNPSAMISSHQKLVDLIETLAVLRNTDHKKVIQTHPEMSERLRRLKKLLPQCQLERIKYADPDRRERLEHWYTDLPKHEKLND